MVWTKLVRHLSVFSLNNLNSVQVWDSKKENVGTKTSFLMTVLCVCSVVSDFFVTPWTVACQAPLSMWFPREKYCSELSLPAPGGLPNLGTKPKSLASPLLAGWSCVTAPPGKSRPDDIVGTVDCCHPLQILEYLRGCGIFTNNPKIPREKSIKSKRRIF